MRAVACARPSNVPAEASRVAARSTGRCTLSTVTEPDEIRRLGVRRLGDPRSTQPAWTLLPAPEGTCSQCARDHDPAQPHDQQALYYQYAFYAEHGRWPTWEDAMAHCDDDTYEFWREQLSMHGVEVAP